MGCEAVDDISNAFNHDTCTSSRRRRTEREEYGYWGQRRAEHAGRELMPPNLGCHAKAGTPPKMRSVDFKEVPSSRGSTHGLNSRTLTA